MRLIASLLLLVPLTLPAQITISDFSAKAGSGSSPTTVTFAVDWNRSTTAADSAWVFVDYNDQGTMTRLELVPGATASPGAVREPNNKGAWVFPLTGSPSVTVQLLSVAVTATLHGACVYAINYPPVAKSSGVNKLQFTGTPPFDLTLDDGAPVTLSRVEPPHSYTYTVNPDNPVVSFTDASKAPGVFSCRIPAPQTLTASDAGYCADAAGVALALNNTEDGAIYQLYQNEVPLGGATFTGDGNAASFTYSGGDLFGAGTYSVQVVSGAFCAAATGGTTVTQKPLPVINTVSKPPLLCGYYVPVSLTVSAAAATGSAITGYQWKRDGAVIAGATHSAYSDIISASGTYTVEVFDANGCSVTSAAIAVRVSSNEGGRIGQDASSCTGAPGTIGSLAGTCKGTPGVIGN
jgi:hypothetical protein